jgi:hypothetical protein
LTLREILIVFSLGCVIDDIVPGSATGALDGLSKPQQSSSRSRCLKAADPLDARKDTKLCSNCQKLKCCF